MNILDVREVLVTIECGTCDGEGTVYLIDASKFPSTCPACEGRKMLNTTIPIADFIKLIRSAP